MSTLSRGSRAQVTRGMLLTTAASLLLSTAARAQVGYPPDASPYEDVKIGQSVSLSAGWLVFGRDKAGVGPESAPFGQLRYDAAIGGPASLFARYTMSSTQRTLLAPAAVAGARETGTPGTTMHIFDGGLDVALTGKKTWHRLMPSLTGGVGIVSDFAAADSGGYQFGAKFALSYGVGLKYVPRSGIRVRADITNFIWQYEYPDRYFVQATDGSAILTDTRDRSAWRGNWGLSVGVSIPVFR